MPDLRTEISEIATGLGMLGAGDLRWLLDRPEPPAELVNVPVPTWQRLAVAAEGRHADTFAHAWANGTAFLRSVDGLRGRLPERVEWKGPDRPPESDPVPADLRIDHVWLVSCKYLSKILHNGSPARVLGEPGATDAGRDWFAEVSPAAYQSLWTAVRAELDDAELPVDVAGLDRAHRARLKEALPARAWPGASDAAYREFAHDVARMSAERWRRSLGDLRDRERVLWWLLRLSSAPYFVLGTAPRGEPVRLRVLTPWDWRQAFTLVDLDVWPDAVGQPLVRWRAVVADREAGVKRLVNGHVEIRWSHGKFQGVPEAKVYLDTPHSAVPGYAALR